MSIATNYGHSVNPPSCLMGQEDSRSEAGSSQTIGFNACSRSLLPHRRRRLFHPPLPRSIATQREALGVIPTAEYSLGSLRSDLSKLRAKSPLSNGSRSPAVTGAHHRGLPDLCRLPEALRKTLCATDQRGILAPFRPDKRFNSQRLSELDKLYAAVSTALDELVNAVGLKAA